MATRFEIALFGESSNPRADELAHLRAAGEEAIAEIQHWHARLSAFDAGSFVSYLNAHAPQGPVACDPEFFGLLAMCRDVWAASDGAFDVSLGALLRAAGLRDAPHGSAADLDAARQVSGFEHVHLDPAARTVAFTRKGVRLDLGAVGKGLALDCAAARLTDAGVNRGLLHGGTSSVLALDAPSTLPRSHRGRCHEAPRVPEGEEGVDEEEVHAGYPIALGDQPGAPIVTLRHNALGVSASRGRTATDVLGVIHGHVLYPQSGESIPIAARVAVVADSAALADAWSTAALVLGQQTTAARLPTGVRAIWC